MGQPNAHAEDAETLTWRELGAADVDAVEALHHRAHGARWCGPTS